MSVDTVAAFRRVVKEERKARGWSHAKMAELIGISQQSISFYETGGRVPDIRTARKIAECFGVSMDYLCGMSMRRTGEKEVDCERIASCE